MRSLHSRLKVINRQDRSTGKSGRNTKRGGWAAPGSGDAWPYVTGPVMGDPGGWKPEGPERVGEKGAPAG